MIPRPWEAYLKSNKELWALESSKLEEAKLKMSQQDEDQEGGKTTINPETDENLNASESDVRGSDVTTDDNNRP